MRKYNEPSTHNGTTKVITMKNVDIKSLAVVHDGDIHDYEVGFHYTHWFDIYIAVRELQNALERADVFIEKEAKDVGGAGYDTENKKYYTAAQLFDLVGIIEDQAEKSGVRGVTVVIDTEIAAQL